MKNSKTASAEIFINPTTNWKMDQRNILCNPMNCGMENYEKLEISTVWRLSEILESVIINITKIGILWYRKCARKTLAKKSRKRDNLYNRYIIKW